MQAVQSSLVSIPLPMPCWRDHSSSLQGKVSVGFILLYPPGAGKTELSGSMGKNGLDHE